MSKKKYKQKVVHADVKADDYRLVEIARMVGWASESAFIRDCIRRAGPELLDEAVRGLETQLAASQTHQHPEPASLPAPEPEPDPSPEGDQGST